MSEARIVRVATYNIHKARGMDGRVRPDRIVQVLREVDADIIALQEVLSVTGHAPESDQPKYLADQLGLHFVLGENRKLHGGDYGNVMLSRFPIEANCKYNLSVGRREKRGCLRADVRLRERQLLHVFNVHLGTAFFERRHQGRMLLSADCIASEKLKSPRIVMGDFNEWTRGLSTDLLSAHMKSADIRTHLNRLHTYPGLFPFLHLDHIYYDPVLELRNLKLHKSRAALLASDHLPLVAEFTTP